MKDVYKRLAEKLDGLPQGYPATETGVELKILEKIYTPEEAEMALKIRPIPETAEVIAQKLRQAGFQASTRSVERVIAEYGLQKKTLQVPPPRRRGNT